MTNPRCRGVQIVFPPFLTTVVRSRCYGFSSTHKSIPGRPRKPFKQYQIHSKTVTGDGQGRWAYASLVPVRPTPLSRSHPRPPPPCKHVCNVRVGYLTTNDSPMSHGVSRSDVTAGLTHAGSSPGWRETPLGRRGQSNKIYGHDSRPTFGSNLRVPITRRYRGAGSPAHGSLQCRFSQWKGAVCCKERRRECGGARGEHPAGGADWW
ncbi:hypothetical protein E2C01_030801 [Portunus trituberculatus]|uniref:Uncharacterized protein n=1 Tax=Portunus trituberculatus TaxID=210409 RepID=A0A5B7EVV2_PORTR|nr:hypothetical protein [Portunus trituberculatus]